MSTSPTITMREIDFHDDGDFDLWHRIYWDSQIASRGQGCTAFVKADIIPMMRNQSDLFRHRGWLGYDAQTPVVAVWMGTPLKDNLHAANVSVDVDPAHRRRGVGSQALAFMEDLVLAEGRRTVVAQTDWSPDLPESGEGAEGPDFLLRRGYHLGLAELQRRLDLPVAEEILARFEAETAQRVASYRLESRVGPVPDEWLEAYAALDASVGTEAPTGELEIEPRTPDPDAIRVNDANEVASGRTRYGTYAFDPDGQLVAFSDLVTPAHEPGRSYQMGTIVARAHRGHRLGMAVKVANARFLQETDPTITHILTWNAAANAHMIGVNEELGFRISERCGEFQKHLGTR